MNRIAIIPARAGSKGLKNKNIKLINGKPLIAYTIEAAKQSNLFTVVHVSTDSEKYAEISKKYGADVPFLRSSETSSDTASSWDVVNEVICNYAQMGKHFDECALLQPTSPLRDSDDIVGAFNIFESRNSESVVSVCEVDHPVEWCFKLDDMLSMQEFNVSPYKDMRRQDLSKHYRENGAIYILKTSKLTEEHFNFYGPHCNAFVMEKSKSIDIDTETDFYIAEYMLKAKRTK